MTLRTLALAALTFAPATALVVTVAAPTPAAAKKKKKKKRKKKNPWKKAKKGVGTATKATSNALNASVEATANPMAKFTIYNCSERKATVCVYNSGDNIKVINRKRKGLIAGKVWKDKCSVSVGKGWCKIYVTEADMACPVDPGNDIARVGDNQNLYIGVKKKEGKTYTAAKPAPLWARRGEDDHCEVKP